MTKTDYAYLGRSLTSKPFKVVASGLHGKTFFVHKDLIAPLSVELQNHISNDMQEGRSNTLVLKGVSEGTVERFLKWAYTGDYDTATIPKETLSILTIHGELYVLAERFNVATLKHLTYRKITAEVDSLKYPDEAADLEKMKELLGLTLYAFEHLPVTSPAEKLLDYLVRYIAWALDPFRECELLWELMRKIDFAVAILKVVRELEDKPVAYIEFE